MKPLAKSCLCGDFFDHHKTKAKQRGERVLKEYMRMEYITRKDCENEVHISWHFSKIERFGVEKKVFDNYASLSITDQKGNNVTMFFDDEVQMMDFVNLIANTAIIRRATGGI